MVKQRLWQTKDKKTDMLVVELYEPEYDPNNPWEDRWRSMRKAIEPYKENGYTEVETMIGVGRLMAILEKPKKT